MSAEMMSRRSLLATGLAFAAIASPSREAAAQQKITKQAAKYQYAPKGQQRCEICLQFMKPNQCKIVEGPVSPRGWCQYFAARENAE